MRPIFALAASILVTAAFAQSAGAQQWPHRGQGPQNPAQQPANPYQQPARPNPQAGAGGGCVPSGFARLTRNCSVNTGACQRMPDSCNRGWCCP
jgi:hypothetical protein